jgi:translation initiation factor 2 alpha subunit (eIF-2alpha)
MKKYQTFTEYLQDIHGKQYQGFDDEMPDDWEHWLSELSVDELIDYADDFAIKQARITSENIIERISLELKKEGVNL